MTAMINTGSFGRPREPASTLDIVAVLPAAVFEDKDELVLAAVEGAYPGIVLDPDAQVFTSP